ncbi:hypothetical protein P3X46_017663 [Hevea brasiliensis]|uniref:NADP-dependent oxidoreductase domain-containing protein n=1 Tax=Hevea brasiliensis TaxID=3981 RepID=A0ABQ9LQ74_HEVBR|nr:hypothetical protein P3X46_017663 [Hevea brasiliensis]
MNIQHLKRSFNQWTTRLCGQPWKIARGLASQSPLESATSLVRSLRLYFPLPQIPPSVNQVEMSPVWQQKKLIEFCKTHNVIVTAFSPLGAKGANWGSNLVMDNEVLKEIAKEHGKTVAQVSLGWIIEQGATLAVKSYKKERLKENMEIFDGEYGLCLS